MNNQELRKNKGGKKRCPYFNRFKNFKIQKVQNIFPYMYACVYIKEYTYIEFKVISFFKKQVFLKKTKLYKHERLSHLKLKTEADIDSKFCV